MAILGILPKKSINHQFWCILNVTDRFSTLENPRVEIFINI